MRSAVVLAAAAFHWSVDPCTMSQALVFENVTLQHGALQVTAKAVREITNGTASVTVGQILPRSLDDPICEQGCAVGAVELTLPLPRFGRTGGIEVTGFTPDFRGLQLLTCSVYFDGSDAVLV